MLDARHDGCGLLNRRTAMVLAHRRNRRHGVVGPLRANRNGSTIGRIRLGDCAARPPSRRRRDDARVQCPREANMTHISRAVLALFAIAPLAVASGASAQTPAKPYGLVEKWAQIRTSMNGGKWGEVIGVKPGLDGSIWVLHRCFNVVPPGSATCVGRDDMPPIMEFGASGRLLDSFGQGLLAFPHGFHIDHDGNIWVTDANDKATVLGLSAKGRGHQVFKLDPHGKILLALGKAGVAGKGHDTFDRPTDVAIGTNGDIFVTDGHGKNDRVVKFTKDGRYVKEWGRTGSGPGEFNQPHAL